MARRRQPAAGQPEASLPLPGMGGTPPAGAPDSLPRRVLAIVSPSAAARRRLARDWIRARPAPADALIVATSRGAADDLAREIAATCGATFGIARASVRELLVKLALPALAARGDAPASMLALEALAARVTSEALAAGALGYLAPVVGRPGFRRALITTLGDLRLAGVPGEALAAAPRTGTDLRVLAEAFDRALAEAHVADHAQVLACATDALAQPSSPVRGRAVVLLDVPIATPRERAWLTTLAGTVAHLALCLPAGDADTRAAVASLDDVEWLEVEDSETDPAIARIQRALFRDGAPAAGERDGDAETAAVEVFSAPGEGREAVEIARRILREASAGRAFDEMAIVVRAPSIYATHVETALHRAGIPAWFSKGTRRPDPAGRAFLAVLACAAEGLSASRFAEYVSLGQVPPGPAPGPAAWVPPQDDPLHATSAGDAAASDEDGIPPVVTPSPPTHWRWERLLNDAAVIGGADRWTRRLAGLQAELSARAEELARDDPDAPRRRALDRDRAALDELRAFALPVVEELATWPRTGAWGEWIARFEAIAPRVLARPGRVLGTLADLRAMTTLGPVSLDEVRDVLTDRLADLHVDPPAHRQGRVFVGTPDTVRGRTFPIVFVAGLAERVFPQRSRPDPLLLDAGRAAIADALGVADGRLLPVDAHRTHDERLRLHLAVGAASAKLYCSFPSMEVSSARARVPSFYALDVHRALTGRLPDHDSLAAQAAAAADARLAWPAPPDPMMAIDVAEHDLATLKRWLHEPRDVARGRARYLLDLSAPLARSLRTRFVRARQRWAPEDGLFGEPHARAALSEHRLRARPYSPTSLQRFAACPYQFYLSSVLRLVPREEASAVHRLDPLTRGRLVHDVIATCTRALLTRNAWPSRLDRLGTALAVLDEVIAEVAERYRDALAPAIDGVWHDEIAGIHADLRGWLQDVALSAERWTPMLVEFGIGFGARGDTRDAASVPTPATLDGGWRLHGIVDAIEQDATTGALRVTDYKTGRDRTRTSFVVGGGDVLQPSLYGLAVEAVLERSVEQSRLFFCTAVGRYASRPLALTPDASGARRTAIEVLEIIDRALELGFLPRAPKHDACDRCDFRPVCGPHEERRAGDKDPDPLADLRALRALR